MNGDVEELLINTQVVFIQDGVTFMDFDYKIFLHRSLHYLSILIDKEYIYALTLKI